MAYKDMEKKRAANARAKAKLLAKNPHYYRDWMEKKRAADPEAFKEYERSRADRDERAKKYYERNQHKIKIRKRTRLAVSRGEIIKPEECSNCHRNLPLQIDHYDYSVWWKFNWLCRDCHNLVTKTRIRAGVKL